MSLNLCHINQSWTLFLDRDGVINRRLVNDYVKTTHELELLDGVPEAISEFNKIFGKIFIVTNQQGISKGLMTEDELDLVHDFFQVLLMSKSAYIDKIYYCKDLENTGSKFRKPEIGMALQAKKDFPEIDFSKSIMVGDSMSDMEFGRKAGMFTCFINESYVEDKNIDLCCTSLLEFAKMLIKNIQS